MLGSLKKKVEKIFSPSWHNEGVGAKVLRIIGVRELPRLDPFLMLDYFFVKLPAGFPDHPHRGFETVTYMKKGKFYHEDFKGHKGVIGPGDIQWMTAGKGIVHSEMPASYEEESQGFQLWLNLEKKNKLCDPQYQEFTREKIPVVEKDGNQVTVIAGEAFDTKGPIVARTPAFYLDITMKPKSTFSQIIPKRWNSMCFVYSGSGLFADPETKITKNQAVVLKQDDNELLEVKSQDEELKFIIFAGLPIGEPIAQHGPFVMNEQPELQAAIRDYSNSRNGFENAQVWESQIQYFVDPAFHQKYIAESGAGKS